MRRISCSRAWFCGAVVAVGLVAVAPASAVTGRTVTGTVGPGFTIALTMNGQKVTKLKAGTPYRFVISDRSDIHDFHLRGPGIDRVLTSVDYSGTKQFTLTLKKGTYRFYCDPHAGLMHGVFRVN